MNKKYTELEYGWGNTIEDAVEILLDYNKKGHLGFIEFNGHKLYSDTVTMDSAYLSITGSTKVEFDNDRKREIEEYEKERLEHEENIPTLIKEWIEKGKEILTEDKLEYWNQIVPIRLDDMYRGMELGCCLDIIKVLNSGGTLEEAREEIRKQSHSGTSYGLVKAMVKEFCERGQEFAEFCR